MMNMFIKKWMVCLTAFLLLPVCVFALELVYPADGTSVRKSNYVIIKAGNSPVVDGLTVEINGVGSDLIDISSVEYKQAFADLLILMPDLDPGLNKIVLNGITGGKSVAKVEAEVYFVVNPWDDPPEQFPPFILHLPQKESLCAPCHNMDPSSEELNSFDPRKNPCNSCHKRMIHKKHVHGPAGVLECTTCHDAASGPAKYAIEGRGNQLCLECHEDKFDDFKAQKFMHGPVETGDCLVCHSPHATDEFAQVRGNINSLCQACHQSFSDGRHILRGISGQIHPVAGVFDPTRSNRDLNCTSCHNPHGGQAKNYFVNNILDRFVLCQYCHKK